MLIPLVKPEPATAQHHQICDRALIPRLFTECAEPIRVHLGLDARHAPRRRLPVEWRWLADA